MKFSKLTNEYFVVFCILILSFILRLVAINQSLWHDEAISAQAARDHSYFSLASDFASVDNHPPLYYLSLKLWSSIFGNSEIDLRSLSVVFGVATIFCIYKLSQRLLIETHKQTHRLSVPVIIALLLATSPLHIYYSQEVRMYSMGVFVSVFCVWAFMNIIRKNTKNSSWFIFSISLLILSMTDYVLLFLIPSLWIFALTQKYSPNWWKKFLISHVLILAFYIFWYPVLQAQFEDDKLLLSSLPNWKNISGGATIKQALLLWAKFVGGRISYLNKVVYAFLIATFSIPYSIVLLESAKRLKNELLLWLWLVVPITLGFFISYFIPVFIYFRFLFVIPALYLILGIGVNSLKMKGKLLFTVIIIANLLGWSLYALNPNQHREDWRGAVQFMKRINTDNNLVIFNYNQVPAGYTWYAGENAQPVGVDSINQVVEDVDEFYYFDYLSDLTDPNREILDSVVKLGFNDAQVYNFRGVGQIRHFIK